MVKYQYFPGTSPADPDFRFSALQRLRLKVDGQPTNSVMVTRDANGLMPMVNCLPDAVLHMPEGVDVPCASPIEILYGNPLTHFTSFWAVQNGEAAEADNFHQTWRDHVPEPGLTAPGCEECVHIHWRWSDNVMTFLTLCCYGDVSVAHFGDGSPLIPHGSTQSVAIQVYPDDAGQPVFEYAAESSQAQDTFFSHGGWFAPRINLFAPENLGPESGQDTIDGREATIASFVDGRRASFDSFFVQYANAGEEYVIYGTDTPPAADGTIGEDWFEVGRFRTSGKRIPGVTGSRGAWEEFTFAPVEARYIIVLGPEGAGAHPYRVYGALRYPSPP